MKNAAIFSMRIQIRAVDSSFDVMAKIWKKLHKQIENEKRLKGRLIFFWPLKRTRIPNRSEVRDAEHSAIIKFTRRKFIY
jgi:hypothetical protein